MGLLDKLKFQAWDDVGAVVSLIHKWKPDRCKTEREEHCRGQDTSLVLALRHGK